MQPMKVSELVKKLGRIADEIKKGHRIVKEMSNIISRWCNALEETIKKRVADLPKPFSVEISGKVGTLTLCKDVGGEVRIRFSSPELYVPEEIKPLYNSFESWGTFISVLRFLTILGDEELLKSLDKKIDEVRGSNKKLEETLENLKEILSPLIAASKV